METALELQDISKRFGTRWALARLSYTLPRGESLLLTGHNGSGKTTLLRILATVLSPTVGKLRVLGVDTADDRDGVREQVALLSHANYLYEDLTAEQNVVLLAKLLGVPDPKARSRALLERMGLGTRMDHPVREFSAGMRKRVAVARLLLKAPRVALLDEPFGELDPAGIAQMEGLVRELQSHGTSVVLATHLVEQGKNLCSRRMHLENGRAVEA